MNSFALITLLLPIIENALSASGVIPSEYKALAEGIVAAVNVLKSELTGASGALNVTAATLTAAIAAGLSSLVKAGALPASWGALATALASAAAAGVAAGTAAASAPEDPNTIQPISPVA